MWHHGTVRRSLPAALVLALTAGCWTNAYYTNRELHYVHDEHGEELLVRTPAPSASAYASYLRAKLALERQPPQLEEARGHILDALHWQPNEPQLWTVKAQIEWQAGDFEAAEAALAQALMLRPGYAEAQRLLVQLSETQL